MGVWGGGHGLICALDHEKEETDQHLRLVACDTSQLREMMNHLLGLTNGSGWVPQPP